jgi:hypothetical protein
MQGRKRGSMERIARDTVFTVTDTQLIKTRKQTVGGMSYIVNSFFDWDAKRSIEDNVKYLMTAEASKTDANYQKDVQ